MKQIKVSIFEDNKPRRDLLELLLNSTDGMICSGTFNDCSNVIEDIKSSIPDAVLMDIDMPYVNGIEGLKLIRKQFPEIKILMQTIFEEEDKIFQAICAGADGYILKKVSPDKLIEAIRDVMEGGAPMTPVVAKQVLKLFNNKHTTVKKNNFELSPREIEVLQQLGNGLSYKMIAEKCNISYSTVNTHINHIYEKLKVNSAIEAVKKAMDERII